MHAEIKGIFNEKILINDIEIPVVFREYKGSSTNYVVYYSLGAKPYFCAEDEIQNLVYTYEFNVYSKGNYIDILNKVKKIMKDNDYQWCGDGEDLYETDTKYHHIVVTFEKIGGKEIWQE